MMLNDQDLCKKTKKTCEKISENLYIIANEPSLACYRLQEHVHKSAPTLSEKRDEMKKLQKSLQGTLYDLEYSIGALKTMDGCEKHYQNVKELLKNSVFLKQQIDYEENVRMRVASNNSQTNVSDASSSGIGRRSFQRFSASFDLPSSFMPPSIASVSASADLKDLKSVISHIASSSSSPVTRRNRTGSLSTPSKRMSEPITQQTLSQTPPDN